MRRTRVKICGVTRVEDALAAAEAGADYIGIVMQPGLARSISPKQAGQIVDALPRTAQAVGLFVDAEIETMRTIAREAHFHCVQLHGNESWETAESLLPIPVFMAVHVEASTFMAKLRQLQLRNGSSNPIGYVMDTAGGGGKGAANDWQLLASHMRDGNFTGALSQWFAAGGLTPGNVGNVVRQLRPWGVDVSSGVEISKREKSPELIRRFIRAVRDADAEPD